ncbi:protein NEOXANTHIN-DEFICIENT 1 [Tripterygium wilfordii]|nr:protein NEOXANTHIN-DEFICIENT 1 [Tripterygium wilfordii]XP_038703146.1 protein NEOXANTHIN-DEFICIENT 1 [Tripterygium wilfordii]XP_038703147.1 protein NEOXANTHIN-DEFICIENT 1 [Tripterygium wilfordii]
MEFAETNCSSGYQKPPWLFKGSALYQLHLVKSETARAFIPKECRLVEAFGYTLGGFFLASYDHSPAGIFDELVVVAGIVWNPPTSCAWAARVLVSSNDACDHGRKDVGLPSHVARFSKRITVTPTMTKPKSKYGGLSKSIGLDATLSSPEDGMDIRVTEIKGASATDICRINLTTLVPGLKSNKWMGPQIKMTLPSFSGRTEYNPNLLKYSCHMDCRVRTVQPVKVLGPSLGLEIDREQSPEDPCCKNMGSITSGDDGRDLSISVMLSRPIIALQFSCLKMTVEAPVVISNCSRTT